VGPNYLVMELLEGETLAARLKRGKLSVDDSIKYGAQIADAPRRSALQRDHPSGSEARQYLLGKAGAKVLDFGLAKSTDSETVTGSNAVMGTPAYMLLNKAEERRPTPVPTSTALGLVLYEMAAGHRPAQGSPPVLDGLPDKFAHVVERCLTREPENRWQTARDVKAELEWAVLASNTQPVSAEAIVKSSHRRLAWLGVAGAVVTASLAGFAWAHFRENVSGDE